MDEKQAQAVQAPTTGPVLDPKAQSVQPVQPVEPEKSEQKLVKSFTKSENNKMAINMLIAAVVVLAGVGSGFLGSKVTSAQKTDTTKAPVVENQTDTEAGVASADAEEAEGILREGGIDGEGSYHLDREENLGPGKNVYLTSTSLDLSSYVGKEVMVWGKSLAGEKAGWLMDVSKIKVLK